MTIIWQLKQQTNNYKLNKLKIVNNMKNCLIKIFSFLLISILSLTIITNNNKAEANMFNKFKKGFYFEKYKTAEEAKTALLKLHPIGSDVADLVKTLERAGGKCGIYREEMQSYEYISSSSGEKGVGKRRLVTKREIISDPKIDRFFCEYYIYSLPLICTTEWSVSVKVDLEDKNKASIIEVYRDFVCL